MVWNNNNRNKLRLVEYSVYTWFIVMRSLKLMFLTIHISLKIVITNLWHKDTGYNASDTKD